MWFDFIIDGIYYGTVNFLCCCSAVIDLVEVVVYSPFNLAGRVFPRLAIGPANRCATCDRICSEREYLRRKLKALQLRTRRLEREVNGPPIVPVNESSCRAEDFEHQFNHTQQISSAMNDGVVTTLPLQRWGMDMDIRFHRVDSTVTTTVTLKEGNQSAAVAANHKCVPMVMLSTATVIQRFFYEFGQELGTEMSSRLRWETTSRLQREQEFHIIASHFDIASTNGVLEWRVRNFNQHDVFHGPVFQTSNEGYLVMVGLLKRPNRELNIQVTFLKGPNDENLPTQMAHVTYVTIYNPDDRRKCLYCLPQPCDLENGPSYDFHIMNTMDLDAYDLCSLIDRSFIVKIHISPNEYCDNAVV